MITRNFLAVLFSVILLGLSACSTRPELTPEPDVDVGEPELTGVVVLGKVGDDPVKTIEKNQPIADYLAAGLSDFGIGAGQVKVAPNIETMAAWLEKGDVHVFFDNAYSNCLTQELSPGKNIVLRVKTGAPTKQGVFFTLADSAITSLDDLPGKMIAFQEPNDIVGYMAAKAYLVEAGLNPVEKENANVSVAEGDVGYIFSGDEENTIAWVLEGLVDVGIMESDDYEEYQEEYSDTFPFVILDVTVPLTRSQPGLAPADLDPALTEAIIQLLVELADVEGAEEIMASSKTQMFIPYTGEGKAAVEEVHAMCELVGK